MRKVKETSLFTYYQLESGSHLIRYDSLTKILEADHILKNGVGWRSYSKSRNSGHGGYHDGGWIADSIDNYLNKRREFTTRKQKIVAEARKQLSADKEFLQLVYKAKSAKRTYTPNRHGGVLSMPAYVTNQKDVFLKRKPGAKKATIDMAFQVGRLSNESYTQGFVGIVKTILMAQALGLNLNIDMFDSDVKGIDHSDAYTIVRVADSRKKLNMNDILLCSDRHFFDFTLFNSYSGASPVSDIDGYLSSARISRDLSPMYDVIGGNMYIEDEDKRETVSQIMKIARI